MRANKIFCVVAYDIAVAKRRKRVIKIIEPFGKRINFSVFECMFTENELKKTINELNNVIVKGVDQIAIYTICVNCYTKTYYIPPIHSDIQVIKIAD